MKKYLIAIIAAITLLGGAAVSYAYIPFPPNQGGTGSGVTPSYGQILIGNSSGTYTPSATTSLGVVTNLTAGANIVFSSGSNCTVSCTISAISGGGGGGGSSLLLYQNPQNGYYVSTTSAQWMFGTQSTTTKQLIDVNGGAYFSSNVGIGTTSPYSPLSVVGQAVVSNLVASSISTSSITNLEGTLYADNFPGADMGAQINAAYAACPSTGCNIKVPLGTFPFSTEIAISTFKKPALIECDKGTTLQYTGTATSSVFNVQGNPTNGTSLNYGYGFEGCILNGPYRSGSSGQATVGIEIGGTNGGNGFYGHSITVTNFGTGIYSGIFTWNTLVDGNSNIYENGQGVIFPTGTNNNDAGEGLIYTDDNFFDNRGFFDNTAYIDAGNSYNRCVNMDGGVENAVFSNSRFDDCQLHIGSGGLSVTVDSDSFENPGWASQSTPYFAIDIATSTATRVSVTNDNFFNDANMVAQNPTAWVQNAAYASFDNITLDKNGSNGALSVTNFLQQYGAGGSFTMKSMFNIGGNSVTGWYNSVTPLGTVGNNILDFLTSKSNGWPFGFTQNSSGNENFYNGGQIVANSSAMDTWMIGSTGASPLATLTVKSTLGTSTLPEFIVASTTGTVAMQIQPNGNVGIGTTTPGSPLEVAGGTGSADILDLTRQTSGQANTWGDSISSSYTGTIGTLMLRPDTVTADLAFTGLLKSNVPQLTIKGSTGAVGIGSTTPTYPLSVEGSSSLGNTATAGSFIATTSVASQFPYASTTAISSSNLTSGNCVQASTGGMLTTSGSSCGTGTVTFVGTNNGLAGGGITTSGTIGLDTSLFSTNSLVSWNGSRLAATGTPGLYAGFFTGTSTATTTFPNLGGELYVPSFTGSDIAAQFNAAYAAAPANGAVFNIPAGTFSYSGTFSATTAGKPALINCAPGGATTLVYTGTATSSVFNVGTTIYTGWGIKNCVFIGSGGNSVGVEAGGTNGAPGFTLQNVRFDGFGKNVAYGNNTFDISIYNSVLINSPRSISFEGNSNSGEGMYMNHVVVADCQISNVYIRTQMESCINVPNGSISSLDMENLILDDAGIFIADGAVHTTISGGQIENPDIKRTGAYSPISFAVNGSSGFATLNVSNMTVYNDATTSTKSFPWVINNGGPVTINNVGVENDHGITMPSLVNNNVTGWQSVISIGSKPISSAYTVVATSSLAFEVDQANNVIRTGAAFDGITLNSSDGKVNLSGYALDVTAGHNIISSQDNPIGSPATPTAWPVMINNPNSTNASSTGLAFSVSNTVTGAFGGGIGFQRVGGGSYGDTSIWSSDLNNVPHQVLDVTNNQQVGIGSTSPWATLSVGVNTWSPTQPMFAIGSSTASGTTTPFEVDGNGHIVSGGKSPTVTGGTSSMVAPSNDNAGQISVVGTALTSVTMTFASPWKTAPICLESDNQTAITGDVTSVSTRQVVFGFGTGGVTTATIWYNCQGTQ